MNTASTWLTIGILCCVKASLMLIGEEDGPTPEEAKAYNDGFKDGREAASKKK